MPFQTLMYLDILFQIERYQIDKIKNKLLEFISKIRNIVKFMRENNWNE